MLDDLADNPVQGGPVGFLEHPQRSLRDGGGRDDVGCLARLEHADRHDDRVGRVRAPADGTLQRDHALAESHDRVCGQLRVTGVPAGPLDRDLDVVGRRVDRADSGGHRAERQLVLQVNGHNRARLMHIEQS